MRREGGFTLIELMIVIAIIAILAAVAVTQYSAYKKKAKAKDLIGYARACAMEIVTRCQTDTSSFDPDELAGCKDVSDNASPYFTSVTIGCGSEGKDCSDYSCNSKLDIYANATIDGTDYKAICTINGTTLDVSCKGVF